MVRTPFDFMDALLPIIRRKRRPLLPVDAVPPVVPSDAKPVDVVAPEPTEIVVTDEKPKLTDDEAA